MTTEAFQIAKFKAGAYLITGNLATVDHAVAAVHEDLHGIIRRSTPFGEILRVAEGKLAASTAETDVAFLHMLTGRGRTSEEVLATYGAVLSARSAGPEKPAALAAQKSLLTNVGYGLYAKIGEELVGTELPAVASVALDAIIRFCWSACALPPIEAVAADLNVLRTVSPEAFPDRRLALLRKSWTTSKLQECISVLDDETRTLLTRKQPTARELFQVPDDAVFVLPPDAATEVNQLLLQLATAQAMALERSVTIVFDKLCAMYPDGPLSARSNEEVLRYLATSRLLPTGKAPTGFAFPEVLQLRAEPRKVRPIDAQEVPRGAAAAFVRLREAFEEQLQWLGGTRPPGRLTAYRAWAVALQTTAQDQALPIRIMDTDVKDPEVLAHRILEGSNLVAIWASAYLSSPRIFANLFNRGAGVWLICDVQPDELLAATRSLIPELHAQWLAPAPERQNAGVLVAQQVGGSSGRLDGIAFPSSAIACQSQVLPAMHTVLGDSLRGVGPGPLLYEESHRRHAEAVFLARWLVETEMTFSFLGRHE
jgi:hypothetical protein